MATIEDLMHANLFEVFGERDADRRMEAVRRTYAADVHFSDPDDAVDRSRGAEREGPADPGLLAGLRLHGRRPGPGQPRPRLPGLELRPGGAAAGRAGRRHRPRPGRPDRAGLHAAPGRLMPSAVSFADWKRSGTSSTRTPTTPTGASPRRRRRSSPRTGRCGCSRATRPTHEPEQVITGRADLAATFDHLIRQYDATTYLNGQSTIVARRRHGHRRVVLPRPPPDAGAGRAGADRHGDPLPRPVPPDRRGLADLPSRPRLRLDRPSDVPPLRPVRRAAPRTTARWP